MKRSLFLGVLVIGVLVVAGCGSAEPNLLGPGEAGFGGWPVPRPDLDTFVGAQVRYKPCAEVPNYDADNIGALYDLGFVLGMFVFGSLSAFITNESGNKAMQRVAPRPVLIGAGLGVGVSQPDRAPPGSRVRVLPA